MTYRLIRNKLVWIILAALVVLEVLMLFGYAGCFVNHTTYSRHDHDGGTVVSEYAEFEKEDPLLINKLTQNIYIGKYDFAPSENNSPKYAIIKTESAAKIRISTSVSSSLT